MIQHIVWWGFYHLDSPPATETMRIRFYDARPGDGLPGAILYEESFLDPSRTATGLIVFTGVGPHEYIYHVDLMTPFELAADTLYWLEIVQVGDLDSHYRWEFGTAAPEDEFAFCNPIIPNWMSTGAGSWNNALQLWTVPEPSSFVLLAFGLGMAGMRRSRKEDGWRLP